MAELTVGGVKLHVQRLGAGTRTVVFLHGLVMDNLSSYFFTLANPVARTAEVVLYDLRGHGKSERPPSGYSVAGLVAELAGLLDGCGIARPVQLVGNSFGGLLALAFAAAHPARVAAIALIDAHLGTAGWGESMARTLELKGEERDQLIAQHFKSWLGRDSDRKRSRLAQSARALVEQTSLIEDLRGSPPLSDQDLARLTFPVLALYGAQSELRGDAERLARTLPRCRLETLAGCTHSILWEATDHVRDAVTGFLEGGG